MKKLLLVLACISILSIEVFAGAYVPPADGTYLSYNGYCQKAYVTDVAVFNQKYFLWEIWRALPYRCSFLGFAISLHNSPNCQGSSVERYGRYRFTSNGWVAQAMHCPPEQWLH